MILHNLFICKYPNCYKIFGNLNSFKKHLNSSHRHGFNNHNNHNLNNITLNSTIQPEFGNIINLPTIDETLISKTSVKSLIL